MTIKQQLYRGFGLILITLAVLLLVDVGSLLKAQRASSEAASTLEGVRTVENVRYQIMQNRLDLNNFLLSGDPRDEDRVNKGLSSMGDMIKRGQSQASTEALRNGLLQVESTETNWADNFAKPMLAKRHQ